MIEIINHIGNITIPGNYKPQQSIPVKRNDSNGKRDFSVFHLNTFSKIIRLHLNVMTVMGN
jgi:hypothetical protein